MSHKKRGDVRPRRWQGNPDASGKRLSVHVGACGKTEYGEVKGHLGVLQNARRFGRQAPAATLAWLAEIGDVLHEKIARAGLCEPRVKSNASDELLATFIAAYIERRKDLGERARLNLRQAEAKLVEFFGKAKSLGSVTVGDAKAFRQSLEAEEYAQATIAMHVKKARQFLADAVDREMLTRNPFAKVRAGSQVNQERMRYVPSEAVELVMAVATPKLRLVLALARYAGLRCPSEMRELRWDRVLWDKHRMHVKSDKTRRQGKPSRFVPLAAQLRSAPHRHPTRCL